MGKFIMSLLFNFRTYCDSLVKVAIFVTNKVGEIILQLKCQITMALWQLFDKKKNIE